MQARSLFLGVVLCFGCSSMDASEEAFNQESLAAASDGAGARFPWSSPSQPRGVIPSSALSLARTARAAALPIDLFFRAADSSMRHRGMDWSGTIGSETNLGGVSTTGPDAVATASDRLDVVAGGTDGWMWQRTRTGGAWSDWRRLQLRTKTEPGLSSTAPDRLDLTFHTLDGSAQVVSSSGLVWGPPASIGGAHTSGLNACSPRLGQVEVVTRGTDGQIWRAQWTSNRGWQPWQATGAYTADRPAIACENWGWYHLFYRGADGALKHRISTDGGRTWRAEENLGGALVGGPDAASILGQQDSIIVVARTVGDEIRWRRRVGSGWSPWTNTGAFTTASPAVALSPTFSLAAIASADANAPKPSSGSARFRVLVDTNTMTSADAAGVDALSAADGVWYVGAPDPERVLGALASNGRWIVSEDLLHNGLEFWNFEWALRRIGRINAGMYYQEDSSVPNDTVLTAAQIAAFAPFVANRLVVLSRAYSDQRGAYIRAALDDPRTAGVVFEMSPGRPNADRFWGYKEGIAYAFDRGKQVYFLFAPRGGTLDYVGDIGNTLSVLEESGGFGNPNLFFVLANYSEPKVGFLHAKQGEDSRNSIRGALDWLRAYRASYCAKRPAAPLVRAVPGAVELVWPALGTGVKEALVERRVGDGDFALLARVPADAGGTRDVTAPGGQRIAYRITAGTGACQSAPSDAAWTIAHGASQTVWSFAGGLAGWGPSNQLTLGALGDHLRMTSTGNDPHVYSPGNLGLPTASNRWLVVTMRTASTSASGQIFFWNVEQNQARTVDYAMVPNDTGPRDYLIDLASNPEYTGTLRQLRLDPGQGPGTIDLYTVRVARGW